MPAGMSFLQLEGNYVISFRDTRDCLPAFTAVRLDRRRGSQDSGVSVAGSHGDLRGAGITSSSAFGGSARDLHLNAGEASPTARRQRSGSLSTPHKFVITGIPRHVSTDLIKSRLEDVIPGIQRVHRDPDMANKLSHPPVILETRLAYARDAFMLRADWVPVVQRIIKTASESVSRDGDHHEDDDDEEVRFDVPADEPPASDSGKGDRRKSLVQLSVTCPHGRYRGDNTCQICRHQNRRFTFMSDDFLSHAATGGPLAQGLRQGQQQQKQSAKSKWACRSCMACLFPALPRRQSPPPDSQQMELNDHRQPPDGTAPAPVPRSPKQLLSVAFLRDANTQRRSSTYDDVRSNSSDLMTDSAIHHTKL